VPVALIQEAGMASEDIKATSGIFDASLGQVSNETSGRAIRARQEQGEIATYNFPDNISKGVRRTAEILIDLIPKIYDTERSLRILGADGAEKYIKVNQPVMQPDGTIAVTNDLTRGKYDVTVTSGPNFSTQRQEAAEIYTQLGAAVPQVWGVAGDFIMKSMDLPYSEQIADRLKLLLPPQVQEQMAKDKPMPPEVQALMMRANQAMQVVQQQSQLVNAAAQEVAQDKTDADKAKAAVDMAKAELKVAQAQFEAKVAQEIAKITTQQAQLAVVKADLGAAANEVDSREKDVASKESGVSAISQQSAASLLAIQALLEQFSMAAQAIIQKLDQKSPRTTRQIKATRGPEGLNFQIDDLDEAGQVVSSRNGVVARDQGGLQGVVG
jgi:hypothetical protein